MGAQTYKIPKLGDKKETWLKVASSGLKGARWGASEKINRQVASDVLTASFYFNLSVVAKSWFFAVSLLGYMMYLLMFFY